MSSWDLIFEARWVFLDGTLTTIAIFIPASAVSLLVAATMGVAQTSPNRAIRGAAVAFVEFFRGIPLLVQLFWLYFCLPFLGIDLAPAATAIVACGVVSGAYGAEIVRSALRTVPRGLIEAGIALNFSKSQRLFRIIIPTAVPIAIPPMCNQTIELMKSTALVSLITISDLTFQAATLRTTTMRSLEVFTTVLVIYFCISMTITAIFKLFEWISDRGNTRG